MSQKHKKKNKKPEPACNNCIHERVCGATKMATEPFHVFLSIESPSWKELHSFIGRNCGAYLYKDTHELKDHCISPNDETIGSLRK